MSASTRKWIRAAAAVFFAIGVSACLTPPLAAQDQSSTVRPPKLDFTTHTLSNGLQVILLEDHAVPVIDLQVWYHVGGKDERPGHTGFAHLFEHLMFKGSAHVGTEEHSRIIEAVGGFDNAETGDDTTNYFETFPSQYLERVLWLEADRMGSLNVDEANFKSERQVVEEERRLRVDNQPYGSLEEDLRAAAFTVHGYHHTPIGSIADLDKATLEDVRAFFNTYYKPNNATLVIVGDFNSDQALSWTQKYFEGIPASAGPIPRPDTPEPAANRRTRRRKVVFEHAAAGRRDRLQNSRAVRSRRVSARPRVEHSCRRREQPPLSSACIQGPDRRAIGRLR